MYVEETLEDKDFKKLASYRFTYFSPEGFLMLTKAQAQQRLGSFYLSIWLRLDENGVLSLAELAKVLPPTHETRRLGHRMRLANACHDMATKRQIYRVGRGQYATALQTKRRPEHYTFKEQLAQYIEQHGRVQLQQIVAACEAIDKSPRAVRSALERLRKQGHISKDGMYWCWMGNVVQLARPAKKTIDAHRKKHWPAKPESDDDPETWDDDDDRWDCNGEADEALDAEVASDQE